MNLLEYVRALTWLFAPAWEQSNTLEKLKKKIHLFICRFAPGLHKWLQICQYGGNSLRQAMLGLKFSLLRIVSIALFMQK